MLRSLSFKLAVIGLSIAAPFVVRSQDIITASNASISVDVSHDGSGLISIYRSGTSPKNYVSYPDQSYLSILINQRLFTNNPYLPTTSPPAIPYAPILLTNGVDSLIENPDKNDTIRTTWRVMEASGDTDIDIIQDAYPVLLRNGGQVLIRVRVVNHSKNPLSAQAQYLLDVDLTGVDLRGTAYSSDNAQIATKYGYETVCQTFSPSFTTYMPPFFLAFEKDLGVLEFPGGVASGYLTDTFTETSMNLIRPSTFTIVDWPTIVNKYSWGWPASMIGTAYNDEALLYQWPSVTIGARPSGDTDVELARTSYGTGGYIECIHNNDAFTFYPYLQHDLYGQIEFTFPVITLIFNRSVNDTMFDVQATLSVDSFFKIVAPSPVLDGGLMQSQETKPAFIPPSTMSNLIWYDTLNASCPFDTTFMQLWINADERLPNGNLTTIQEIYGCNLDILARRSGDTTAPLIKLISRSGSFDGSACNARCSNMLTIDSGMDQTGILSVNASSVTNMLLTIPRIDTLGKDSTIFSVCVIDSMLDGFATVTVKDEDTNADSMHFVYCTIPDTLAPLIVQTSGKPNIAFSIQEKRPWDRGIANITTISDTNFNVMYNPPNNWHGLTDVQVTAVQADTSKSAELCLEISDIAGNKTDTCFSIIHKSAQGGVEMEMTQPIALNVLPNPSDDRFDIQLSSPTAIGATAEGEILDLLGRTIAKFKFTDSYLFDASKLPAGAYILRVNIGNRVLSQRVMKE